MALPEAPGLQTYDLCNRNHITQKKLAVNKDI